MTHCQIKNKLGQRVCSQLWLNISSELTVILKKKKLFCLIRPLVQKGVDAEANI